MADLLLVLMSVLGVFCLRRSLGSRSKRDNALFQVIVSSGDDKSLEIIGVGISRWCQLAFVKRSKIT